MVKAWPTKDPDERLDYTYDWSADLAAGETLVSYVASAVAAAGTVIVTQQMGPTSVTLWISGGNDGQDATYLIRVTTNLNRIFEDTVVLPIAAVAVPIQHPGDYTPPTPNHLIALFPEFSTATPTQIAYYLTQAARQVDGSWTQGDFGYARMLLAAHLMTTAGVGSSAEAASVNDGSAQFKTVAIGSLRLERFDTGGASASAFLTTRYGRAFRNLLRVNKGGPRVAAGPPGGSGYGDNFGPWTA